MKKIFIPFFLIIILVNTGCKKDFDVINTNVNSPVDVQPSLLLRQVIYDYGEQMSYEGFVAGNALGQYFTLVDFNLFDRHNLSQPQLGGNPWPILYKNLRDNEIILAKSQSQAVYKVYEGPARILKAYMAQTLTDLFGDVPYSDALQGLSGNVTPKYDDQQDIYLAEGGLLDQLNLAIAAIDNYSSVQKLQGDILFNGNLSKWRKFANSLKIKMLMRISDREGDISFDVQQALQAVVNEGDFMSASSDDAFFTFTATQPNSFRMQKLRDGDFNTFVMSQTSDTMYQKFNDPRFELYFRPRSSDATYNGLINGIDASQTSISLANYSRVGTRFRENTGGLKCNFLTSFETQFLLAEAAQKGLISGSALTYYNSGVQLAFDFWGVEMPATYLTVGAASFASGDPIEQILTQKWLGNIINGYESWIEYRRTGFPQFLPVAASLNNGLYPVRMPYPTEESSLNSTNYSSAFSKTNGNSINAKVWWDKF